MQQELLTSGYHTETHGDNVAKQTLYSLGISRAIQITIVDETLFPTASLFHNQKPDKSNVLPLP